MTGCLKRKKNKKEQKKNFKTISKTKQTKKNMFQTARTMVKQSTWLDRWCVFCMGVGSIKVAAEKSDEWARTQKGDYAALVVDVTTGAALGAICGGFLGFSALCFSPIIVPCLSYRLFLRSRQKKDT
jgi:hypothetical protein